MKSPPSGFLYQQEMPGEESGGVVVVGMDVEDTGDPIEILAADFERQPPADADFFNAFEDDFDDSDIA